MSPRVDPTFPPDPGHIVVGGHSYPVYMPFYYASLVSFWVYYSVEAEVVEKLVAERSRGLRPALFDGKGLASLDLQHYGSQGGSPTTEIEMSILSYPESRASDVPDISLSAFLKGQEQTKTIGFFRLHVPCDNAFAIAAGKAFFGEYKFQTTFDLRIPDPNDPTTETWNYTCLDPSYTAKGKRRPARRDIIYELDADIRTIESVPANGSPFIGYSMLDGRLVVSRWNLLDYSALYFPDNRQSRKVRVKVGKSPHPMRKDMDAVFRKGRLYALQVFRSRPAAIESRGAYA